MSGMPGPWSSKVSRSLRRIPSLSASSRTVPPPPCTSAFRANSLAAVTILVWSTRLNPNSAAHFLTACRTRTTSFSDRAGIVSCFSTGIGVPLPVPARHALQEFHPLLDVQGRAHPRQRQAQFHERDGDRGLHADHHGVSAA